MGAAGALDGRRILVIEDDFFVAQMLVAFLEDAGAEVVGPIGRIDEAITFIENSSSAFDGAVLDVNLHGRQSYPIADALAARKIGFVFSTGYGAEAVDEAYLRYPRCEKPFRQAALIAALSG